MEEDSRHLFKSDHKTSNQSVSQHSNSSSQSFQCSHCVLIFKSKPFLLEHLSKVHGLNVDPALGDSNSAPLRTATASNVNPDIYSDHSGDPFACQHCAFTASKWSIIFKHEKKYHKNPPRKTTALQPQKRYLKGKLISVKRPETKSVATVKRRNKTHTVKDKSLPQRKQSAGGKVNSSLLKLTSNTKHKTNSSKGLKTYMRPSQGSITKYLVASPGSHGESSSMSMKSPDLPRAPGMASTALILHNSHSDQSNGSVFKVTASSKNDLSIRGSFQHLKEAQLLVHDPSSVKHDAYDGIIKGPFSNKTGKRPLGDASTSPPAKKLKGDVERTGNASVKTKFLSGSFSFEVSEDEEDKKVFGAELDEKAHLVNGDVDSSNVYYCKHCDYSSKGIRSVSTHYQKMHPYIRYSFKYIQDPDDLSATFRCMECPVEFFTVADLKMHYKETHPEAPNVFTSQSRQLDLVFKCFVCSFTTSLSKLLKEHYKEKHPTHIENNALVYFKYTADRPQKEPSQLDTCEKVSNPRSSDRISVKSTTPPSMETETTPSKQSPALKGVDQDMFQCKNCTFSNKSVVAMLVHYQKSHPKSGVTIDKIKQAVVATSPIKPQVPLEKISASSTSVKLMDKSLISPQKKLSDSSMKAKFKSESSLRRKISGSSMKISMKSKDRPEVSPNKSSKKKDAESSHNSLPMSGVDLEDIDNLFFCHLCNYNNLTVWGILCHQRSRHGILKRNAEAVHIHTAEVRSKGKKSVRTIPPTRSTHKMSTETGSPLTSQADELFFCQFCNYCNATVKGVLGHQNAKHGGHMVTTEDVLIYTAEVRQSQYKVEALASSSSDYNPKQAKVGGQKDDPQHEGEPVSKPYERAEDLFFCQQCNFGHPNIKGVLSHQVKRHLNQKSTADEVFRYTAVIRGQIKKSKAESKKSPLSLTGLPLPLMQEDDKEMLFCQLCNFPQKSVRRVLEHQMKRHRGLKATAEKIFTYSSAVNEQIQKSHLEVSGEQAVKYVSIVQSEKVQTNKSGNSTSRSQSYSKTRSLKCIKCTYTTQHVYLLRRHLRKHNMRPTATDVLRMAFKDGALQAGYHCEWCVFSHSEAAEVFQHCQKHHAERGISLAHISSQLYVGPKALPSKKKKSRLENNDGHHIASQVVECAKMSPPQRSGGNEATVYPCRACSFKASSLKGITSHYRAVHPWSVKEDGSVLDVISHRVQSENRQVQVVEVHNKMSGSLDSYQEPAEFETITGLSSHKKKALKTLHKCHICSAHFDTQHGLRTHYGKKHPDYQFDYSDVEEEVVPPKSESITKQVYRCPRCTYVNTSHHGILTHCQMRHPNLTARADNLQTEEAQFPSMECVKKKHPKDTLRYGGYMCKICPLTRVSLKKLKIHYEEDHHKTGPNMLKPAPKQSTVIKKQLLSKYLSSQGSILPAAFLKNRKSAPMKCHLCKYVCTTQIGLNHHLHSYHKNTPEAETQECIYKCSLCSYSSLNRAYLAKHYTRTHGKAAFLTYYVPVHKRPNPTSPEGKKAVGRQKCPVCSFQSLSEKDMAAHYATEHPEDRAETPQSCTPATESKGFVYKCRVCTYSTLNRKYLATHYKKTHGRAAFDTYFPRRKQKQPSTCKEEKVSKLFKAESEEAAPVRCKKCPKLFFNSCLLLSIHYTHFHSTDFKMDFSELSGTSGKGLEFYICSHCNIIIKGAKALCFHLDHHSEMYRKMTNKKPVITGTPGTPVLSGKQPETKPVKHKEQEELPEFSTIQELARWNVTKVETFILAATPPSSPSKTPERVEPEIESRGAEGYTCKHCGRTFMSLTGLRVHERSHAAMAALKRLDDLPDLSSKHIFDKYIKYRPGTGKPYHCGVCSYRTNVMGLLRSHLTKKHGAECPDINLSSSTTVSQDEENIQREVEESSDLQEDNCPTDPFDESEFTEKPRYSEHPDVQRQLNHYRLKAQADAPQETKPPEDGLLHCEFCNFTTEHQSSVRRHYLHRHNGKKLLRCKDCSFFTGSRKVLEMHLQTGHFNCPSEPTHQKDLRCPLCLYQTKNKNNMIDHIVLHREERVTPIEVRRPKLSRYLQGIVFRCHKCTFTSASDENLRSHLLKHDDIKPYKCRLCYFDCTQLSELEAHLCDKHQVMRNHELVGQINLDQLEARGGTVAEEDEDMERNIQYEEHGHKEEEENMEEQYSVSCENQEGQEENTVEQDNEEDIITQNDVLLENQEQQADHGENIAEQNDEPYQKQGQEDTQEKITGVHVKEAIALPVQYNKNIAEQQNNVEDQKQEQDTQMENAEEQFSYEMFVADSINGQEMENMEGQEGKDGNRAEIDSKADQSDHEDQLLQSEEKEMGENQDQQNPREGKENIVEQSDASQQGQEMAEESSADHEARVAQFSQLHQKQAQDTMVAIVAEQNAVAGVEDAKRLDGDGDIALPHNHKEGHGPTETKAMQQMEKHNQELTKTTSTQGCSAAKGQGLTDLNSGEQSMICCEKQEEESLDVSFMSCEEELVHGENKGELVDHYGAMPVLENEYHREEMHDASRERYNGEDEDESPSKQDMDESPSKQDEDESPSKQDEDESPSKQDEDESPSKQDEDESPSKQKNMDDSPDRRKEDEDYSPERKEEMDDSTDCNMEQQQERADETQDEEEEMMSTTDSLSTPKEAFTEAMGEVTRVLCPLTSDENLFACKFCGRNFINSTELERHVMRHGI